MGTSCQESPGKHAGERCLRFTRQPRLLRERNSGVGPALCLLAAQEAFMEEYGLVAVLGGPANRRLTTGGVIASSRSRFKRCGPMTVKQAFSNSPSLRKSGRAVVCGRDVCENVALGTAVRFAAPAALTNCFSIGESTTIELPGSAPRDERFSRGAKADRNGFAGLRHFGAQRKIDHATTASSPVFRRLVPDSRSDYSSVRDPADASPLFEVGGGIRRGPARPRSGKGLGQGRQGRAQRADPIGRHRAGRPRPRGAERNARRAGRAVPGDLRHQPQSARAGQESGRRQIRE